MDYQQPLSLSLSEKHKCIGRELERLRSQEKPDTSLLPSEITCILDYIHTHLFDSHLKVNLVKNHCRVRNNNVSTRFRTAIGLGIREYIESARLKAARHLLRNQDLEVYLIAMAVGYENHETFCRAFHRYFGQPPSAQRE